MMIPFIRKSLTSLTLKHTSPLCGKSPVPFSLLSLHFLSTSRKTRPDISPTFPDILLHKYVFPPELASKLADYENSERAISVLSFFHETGFSNSQLVKIVRYRPRILASSVEDSIKPKIDILRDFGFSSDAVFKIISSNPAILHLSVSNNIVPTLSEIKGLFGSNNEAIRVLKRCPRFLSVNLNNSVMPNVEFLKSCGVPMESIRIIVGNFPNPFLMKPEAMRKAAEKVKEMGIETRSKSFVYAVPTIASMGNETWELKLKAFKDMGFSDSDVVTMFSQIPRMFCLSTDKIKNVKEFLIATGRFDLSSIVDRPISLGFSIEKRYNPRLKILGILESRNLIKKWPSLRTIYSLTDVQFFERFIKPYELSDVDIPNNFARSKRTRIKSLELTELR